MDGFTNVGPISTLTPGNMKVVRTPAGKRLLLNVGGQYHAVQTDCTHQGCELADGMLEDAKLTCICHFAEFDTLTGQVLNGPAETPLQTYRVIVDGDGVWVEA